MRIVLTVAGALLIVAGSGWALQGMGILPGKVMGGHKEWIFYGAITALVGLGIVAATHGYTRRA